MMMILLLCKDKNGTVQLYIFVHIFEISVVKKKKTMDLHHKHYVFVMFSS